MRFSEKHGHTRIRSVLQVDDIDPDLRTALWNYQYIIIFGSGEYESEYLESAPFASFVHALWVFHFNKPLDELPALVSVFMRDYKRYFFSCPWYLLYDLLEFLLKEQQQLPKDRFISNLNAILERYLSGYRIVGDAVIQITSQHEIETIEETLAREDIMSTVKGHLSTAIALLSDRTNPDYRNTIKESISAVEAMCVLLSGDQHATLAQALSLIEKKKGLHPTLNKAFQAIYGYTSNADGIRHAMLEEANVSVNDAKYYLVSCSAFINYLAQYL